MAGEGGTDAFLPSGVSTLRRVRAQDRGARRIACPLLALWGEQGPLGRGDVLATWRTWAQDVRGAALPRGHHLPEEAPEETTAALRAFLAAMPPRRPR